MMVAAVEEEEEVEKPKKKSKDKKKKKKKAVAAPKSNAAKQEAAKANDLSMAILGGSEGRSAMEVFAYDSEEGHSVVGVGTYRDGEEGWKKVATEFVERNLSEEANLYKERGARMVGIEHLADQNPAYLTSAGGAMVRLLFL